VPNLYVVGPLPFLDRSSSGVSVHSLANSLSESGRRVLVVAQRGAWRNPSAKYEQAEVWQPGYGCFSSIYRFLIKKRARRVGIQHEMFMYGKLRVNALFLIFLVMCRLSGIRIVTTLHHALPNAEVRRILAEGAYTRRELIPVLLLGYRFFNFSVKLLSSALILPYETGGSVFARSERVRVSSVPLVAVRTRVEGSEIERVRTKYSLPENYVLSFGFLSKYKGVEHVIAAAQALSDRIPFAAVAGRNVRQAVEPDYLRYYERLRAQATRAGVRWLDYIPEMDMEPVLKGCRLLVLPYVAFHGASGTLTTGASLGVPILVSRVMEVPEFSEVAIEPSAASLTSAIERFLNDPAYAVAVLQASRRYRLSHSTEIVTRGYASALDA
jgi:glycosyltransferase involved in cell wall biosynthesis